MAPTTAGRYGRIVTRVPRPLPVAAIAAWLLYGGIYALTFRLGGSTIGLALRAGLANAVPDGLLALACFALCCRLDGRVGFTPASALRLHALWAGVLVAAAAGGKVLLLWLDFVAHGQRFMLAPSVVAWQVFLSALIYLAVAAASHAWLIARRLREEEANAIRADALRARAEMAALRAQLNPHFLFNTLHSVLGLVRRDPALAEVALEKLGDLLRYAMCIHRDGVDWTALRNEWEFVETYLALERIRFGDRLDVAHRMSAVVLDQPVPTFSLQPLVENAVRHGVAPRAAGGHISIDARLESDSLRLEVSNDGTGSGAAHESDEGGLGLRVLRDRLDVLYRGAARMSAGPTPNGGYSVVLTLPLTRTDAREPRITNETRI
jgi:signal transduction histidine kinase